uniref:WSN domain-containing protein n=1 Tax=Caenorhabditis tropicalis TaxID=1561998 RepID=A0A1I7UGF1_9PELO
MKQLLSDITYHIGLIVKNPFTMLLSLTDLLGEIRTMASLITEFVASSTVEFKQMAEELKKEVRVSISGFVHCLNE